MKSQRKLKVVVCTAKMWLLLAYKREIKYWKRLIIIIYYFSPLKYYLKMRSWKQTLLLEVKR